MRAFANNMDTENSTTTTASGAPEASKQHTWDKQGFCIYCHNIHRTDGNARSTCSDGFTCKGASAEKSAQRKFRLFGVNYRLRAGELRELPTISQGQFSNLKLDDGKHRVWLSRMTVADGMPYNNAIEVEALLDGVWTSVAQYPGGKS